MPWVSLGLILGLSCGALAERFPIKNYTTADGLPANQITRVKQDSRGFLWIATVDGLSRFDGRQFANFGVERGLPHRVVNDLIETRAGQVWVATGGGVALFDPQASSSQLRFIRYSAKGDNPLLWTNALVEGRSGAIWCGARGGLYSIDPLAGRPELHPVEIGLLRGDPRQAEIESLLEDSHGVLWAPAGSTVYRILPDGSIERYPLPNPQPGYNRIHAVVEDGAGRIWAAAEEGLYRFSPRPHPGQPLIERTYDMQSGLPFQRVNGILPAADGSLWVATGLGIAQLRLSDAGDLVSIRKYGKAEGSALSAIEDIAEDQDGNLWAGTYDAGLLKLNRGEFASYDDADGLKDPRIVSVFESRAGDLFAIADGARNVLHRFDGTRFLPIGLAVRGVRRYFGWGGQQLVLEDRAGEWWLPTGEGLYRFGRVGDVTQLARARPKRVYTARDGLSGNDIFRLFEDQRGDLWIACISPGNSGLSRWNRATGTFQRFSQGDGLPPSTPGATPTGFAEDANGNVWIGFYDGGLARFRQGKLQWFGSADGAPRGGVRALLLDDANRLWIATSVDGLMRVDQPGADTPRFAHYTQGLSSSDIHLLTKDRWGWLVVCTSRGIDRLNPDNGTARHYTVNEAGLQIATPHCAFRDRHGTVWIGTHSGLVRFEPRPDRPHEPGRVYITWLEVSGTPRPISDLGELVIPHFSIGPDQNQVQIAFAQPGFGAAADFGYQYMLEGEDRQWSAPTEQRAVRYAGLPPGGHRFLVRSVSAGGVVSAQAAVVEFTVLRPLWQRWWAVALESAALLSLLWFAHRLRTARLLELERVRTRIATDLHDDIGSSLSQIAVLAEVMAQEGNDGRRTNLEPLARIAAITRDLVDSMSDIVWAVNPRKDHSIDLVQRMRRFAGDLLSGHDIELRFHATGAGDRRLQADVRREIFLIFKEMVHNVARHSGGTRVDVDFEASGDRLTIRFADNGAGFDPAEGVSGSGLVNMRERAKRLGGELKIASETDRGAVISVCIPLARRGRWLRK